MTDPSADETTELQPALAVAAGEHCLSCGARLAADQRYCVECGERRGDARQSVRDALVKPASAATVAAVPPRRPRMSANTSLIAGVGTLLLALGVGVLIGRTGSHPAARSNAPVQLVTVPGAAGAATTAGTQTGASSTAGGASAKTKKKAASSKTASTRPATPTKLPPPVVKIGSKGTGKGYDKKTHKFTGNFFGQ